MKYSEVKQIKDFCNGLFSMPDWREVLENIQDGVVDFEVDNVRFIDSDSIDDIMQDELACDDCILGCFTMSISGVDFNVTESSQKLQVYDAIGRLVKSLDIIEKIQEKYVRHNGYGPHFNSFDGNYDEFLGYYVFDNH